MNIKPTLLILHKSIAHIIDMHT